MGAGLAGARCAETLRAEGFDGDLVLVGEEPVAPYERPALSKEFLAGSKSVDDLLLRPRSFWAEQRIELVLGQRVASVDRTRRTVTTSSGLKLGWDTLVLATGARPRLFRSHRLRECTSYERWPMPRRSATSFSREPASRSWAAASWAPRSPRRPARSEST